MKKIAIVLAVLLIALVGGAWGAVRVLLAPERVRAAVEAQLSASLGEQVRIRSAAARIFPVVGLELADLSISHTSTRIASVSLQTGLRPLFSRRVEDARVTLSGGRVEIPWLIALLTSLSQAPAPPVGSDRSFAVMSVRTIELRDVVLTAGRHEVHVDADGLYQEDRLEVSRLDARAEGTSFAAKGALTSLSRVTGTFSVDAATLNLDTLVALASAARPPAAARRGQAAGTFLIEADVKAREGRGAAISFTNLSARMRVVGSGVHLQPVSLQSFGGQFTGRVDLDNTANVPRTSVTGEASGIDVAAVSAFAGSPGAISGRLAGRASITCACVDLESARARIGGGGQFQIADGEIPGLHMVRAVVLAFGRPVSEAPREGTGERFSKITSSFSMAEGTIATQDLALASPDFDLRGQGTLSTVTGGVNFTADVVLSRELSQQAGRDLVRYAHEGDRVILPATISGTLASPHVFINMEQALGRALRNEIERRGRSWLDRLLRRKPGT